MSMLARLPLVVALAAVWFLACGARSLAEPASSPVLYTVSLTEPQTQMVDIAVTFPEVVTTTLDVALPVWRPGRYAVNDHAGTVRDVRAALADGRELPIDKTDKTTWRISLPPRQARDAPGHAVTVRYRVYANSLADRTRHVDDSHAFLSGSSVFMYTKEHRGRPVRVTVEAPEGWRTATGMAADPAAPGTFTAPHYDALVDSPLEIGEQDVFTFDVDGKPHEVVVWPRGSFRRETERAGAEFAAIVRAQREIFGDLPYDRYVFILHITPDVRGGTEHLNSFVAQGSPAIFGSDSAYRNFLRLISHEMFHTWNVKQLRPADLHPYDYARENYTTLLWLVEGTTSYYDNLALVRADGPDGRPLQAPEAYLRVLTDLINSERARPGLHVQSLAESSFDAWIKFTKPTPDSPNSTVSFYSKGALVSWMLDLEIRRRTGNAASYDDALRTLYQRFPLSGRGYRAADVLDVLEELTGSDFSGFFDDHINRPGDLPLEGAVRTVGLELIFEPARREQGEDSAAIPERAYLGVALEDRSGRTTVSTAYSDGPAYARGVLPGDEIVALNDVRLRAGDLDRRMEQHRPGEAVTLTFMRRDELRTIELTLGGKPDGRWVLRKAGDATDAQKAAYESWLKRPW